MKPTKTEAPTVTILWHDKESKGYTDLLPGEWFLQNGSMHGCIHDIRGPQAGSHKAKCNVRVSGSRADLDYQAFPKFNETHEMFLGVLRLQFKNNDRAHVTQVFWKEKGSSKFIESSTTIGLEQRSSTATPEDIDLISAHEGNTKLVVHLTRERSSKLIAAKKAAALAAKGKLICEVCGFSFVEMYGELGKSYCEVHHRHALAGSNPKRTNLNDLAILCSNCHRIIHLTDPLLSVEKFRTKCLVAAFQKNAPATNL